MRVFRVDAPPKTQTRRINENQTGSNRTPEGNMKVHLANQNITIAAPRPLVFQMLSAFGRGHLPGDDGESSRVLEREGDRLTVEFFTKEGRRRYRTVEEVTLFPPERIAFRHLEGPLHHSSEEFLLAEVADETELSYRGDIQCRMAWLPGVGWLIARFYVRPKYDRVIRRHMERLKMAAQARAARSHIFHRQAPATA